MQASQPASKPKQRSRPVGCKGRGELGSMREDGAGWRASEMCKKSLSGGVGVFCRLGPKSLPTLIAELRAQDRAGQGGRAAGQGSSSWTGHCWTSGADGGADQGRVGAVVMVVVVGGVPVGVLRACGCAASLRA